MTEFLRILPRKSEKTDSTGIDLKDGSYQLLLPFTSACFASGVSIN